MDNKIIIFELMYCRQLKRYKLLIDGEENLYKAGITLKKWICKNDNEFFIFLNWNIILFELTDDIELKIINQTYFPDIKNLKILSKKKNKFYDDDKEEDYSLEGSRFYFFEKDEEEQGDKKFYTVAIYE